MGRIELKQQSSAHSSNAYPYRWGAGPPCSSGIVYAPGPGKGSPDPTGIRPSPAYCFPPTLRVPSNVFPANLPSLRDGTCIIDSWSFRSWISSHCKSDYDRESIFRVIVPLKVISLSWELSPKESTIAMNALSSCCMHIFTLHSCKLANSYKTLKLWISIEIVKLLNAHHFATWKHLIAKLFRTCHSK